MPKRGSSALRRSLDQHWQVYRNALKACRNTLTENHLHDLRLAIRQLLAVLDLLQSITDKAAPSTLKRQLKHQLDHFDTLRDTQVMLLTMSETGDSGPDFAAFANYLQQQARQLLKRNRAFVQAIQPQPLRRKFKRLQHPIQRHPPQQGWDAAAQHALRQAFNNVMQRQQQLDLQQSDSLHRLRIAIKKFRYLQIAAQPLLAQSLDPDACKSSLKWLGQLQDAAVLQRSLAAFYQDALPAAISQYCQNQQQQLLAQANTQTLSVRPLWPKQLPYPAPH